MVSGPDPRFTVALHAVPPGSALDLACGSGRHAVWLAERGWRVTGIDIQPDGPAGIHYIRADLEERTAGHLGRRCARLKEARGEYIIVPNHWDLIVCWLYWQPDLLPSIALGVRHQGYVALAGKTSGRFATSLAAYRAAFNDWQPIESGQNDQVAWLIARKP